jgi:hypothetical protein
MYKKILLRQYFEKLTVILLIISTNKSMASQEEASLTLWQGVNTYHVDRANDEANDEKNRISAVFYDRWFVGFFNNSYSKPSEIVGYQIWHNHNQAVNWQWQYGVSVALATGYQDELATNIDGLVTFGISPYLGVKYRFNRHYALGLDTLYVPTDNGGVLVTGINFTLYTE